MFKLLSLVMKYLSMVFGMLSCGYQTLIKHWGELNGEYLSTLVFTGRKDWTPVRKQVLNMGITQSH